MPALSNSLFRVLRNLADFAFPPICYGCDEETDSGLVCDTCRLLLFTSELDVCPGCGRPCASAADGCGLCRIPFVPKRVRALGLYRAPFHTLVHALKYSQKTALAELLGQALAALVAQDTELASADAVCAIPLHPARLRERGYNQSELLAAEVSRASGIELVDPLLRRKNTSTQTALASPKDRVENVADAFSVRPGTDLHGFDLILVDDVMTTGATLDASARQLLAAGATAVFGLVVAG